MKYWLYTEEYPDMTIEDNTFGITTVEVIPNTNGEEVDRGRVINTVYDTTGYLKPGFTEELFDDAITEEPKRVLKFLFAREFFND